MFNFVYPGNVGRVFPCVVYWCLCRVRLKACLLTTNKRSVGGGKRGKIGKIFTYKGRKKENRFLVGFFVLY